MVTLHPYKTKYASNEEITAYLVSSRLPESGVEIVAQEECPSCNVAHVYKFINEPFKQELDKKNDEIIDFYYCKCATCNKDFTAKIEFCF